MNKKISGCIRSLSLEPESCYWRWCCHPLFPVFTSCRILLCFFQLWLKLAILNFVKEQPAPTPTATRNFKISTNGRCRLWLDESYIYPSSIRLENNAENSCFIQKLKTLHLLWSHCHRQHVEEKFDYLQKPERKMYTRCSLVTLIHEKVKWYCRYIHSISLYSTFF